MAGCCHDCRIHMLHHVSICIKPSSISYVTDLYIIRSARNVPLRNEPDELRTSESCRRPSEEFPFGNDLEPVQGSAHRSGHHFSHSVIICNNSDGCQLCKCRSAHSCAGDQRDHGRQHRYNRHSMARLMARIQG